MYLIRNTVTNQVSNDFLFDLKVFTWLNGDQGFNGYFGRVHGDEKIYKVTIEETGDGPFAQDSPPVYDSETDSFTVTRTMIDVPLTDDRRADIRNQINAQAEQARLQYITPGHGQALSYREKLDEARLCLAAYSTEALFTVADTDDLYPLLNSEVGVNGDNAWQVATVVDQTYKTWRTIEANINGLRQQAHKALTDATTEGEANRILEEIAWPTA